MLIATPPLSPLCLTLQAARKSRRISQLELALRMGISQRHVSFVESGRAKASRDLLLAWLDELNAPLALRNVALQQAGFAASYASRELGDAVLAPAREALGRLLDAHNPMPAMVLDAGWNVLQLNRGARWLVSTLMPWAADLPKDQPINLLDAMLHPQGLMHCVTNLAEVAPALLAHLRDDASVAPELAERVELLAQKCQHRLGKKPLAQWPRQMVPVLTTRFASPHGELAFFSMFSTFGTPQDITLASLRVEHLFAAEDQTRAVLAAQVKLS
jgi:transcriptional regulator with XRE-family HTH domain